MRAGVAAIAGSCANSPSDDAILPRMKTFSFSTQTPSSSLFWAAGGVSWLDVFGYFLFAGMMACVGVLLGVALFVVGCHLH